MKAKLVAFGEIQIEGERYGRDVVIDGGRIIRRRKGPSKAYRDQVGHTPLSAAETIPRGGQRLIVGTGADGTLPIAQDVLPRPNDAESGSPLCRGSAQQRAATPTRPVACGP